MRPKSAKGTTRRSRRNLPTEAKKIVVKRDQKSEELRRGVFPVLFVLFVTYAILLLGVSFVVYIWPRPRHALLTDLLHTHFAAIVGLPAAALSAFIVVWVLRATDRSPLELDAWGMKLKGASGPILLWVICFLAIAIALKMLW
jgi:hypothetical protein